MGLCYDNLNKLEEALKSYEKIIKLDPNSYRAHSDVEKILKKLKRTDEAEQTRKIMNEIAERPLIK